MSEINIKDMTLEQLKDLHKQAGEQIKRMERKPLVAWKPKRGDRYWCADDDGAKYNPVWNDSGTDNKRLNRGNCFQTKEALNVEEELKIALQLYKQWIDENDSERGGRFIVGEYNYYPSFNALSADDRDFRYSTTNPLAIIPPLSSEKKAFQMTAEIGDDIKCLFTQYVEVSE